MQDTAEHRAVTPGWRHRAPCTATAFLALLFSVFATAADLQSKHQFSIPPQPLDTALLAFSDQAKVQVLMWAVANSNARSAGAVGELVALDALRAILANTGFGFKLIDKDTIAIVQDNGGSATASAVESGAVLTEILVTAQKRQ